MSVQTNQQTSASQRGHREKREGVVVSDVRDKTIKVRYEYLVKYPKYEKVIRRRTYLHAHDEDNQAKVGDRVQLIACRRLSKTKCWRLVRVVQRSN